MMMSRTCTASRRWRRMLKLAQPADSGAAQSTIKCSTHGLHGGRHGLFAQARGVSEALRKPELLHVHSDVITTAQASAHSVACCAAASDTRLGRSAGVSVGTLIWTLQIVACLCMRALCIGVSKAGHGRAGL